MNFKRLEMKLRNKEKLRVLFLNDVGFQYGAGIAQLRQIQSFLLLGHEVVGLCRHQGSEEDNIPVVPNGADGRWMGMHQLPSAHISYGCTAADIIKNVVEKICSLSPDVIIVGNLHGASWPLEMLLQLRELEALIVAYMHDCYLVSGRCAYSGDCRKYESGCDADCPTLDHYPTAAASLIKGAWQLRRDIFCGDSGLPLATNSQWMTEVAKSSLKGAFFIETVHLGLDDKLFSPIDRSLARQLLELPQDAFIILGGSVNVGEKRKGGHIFKAVVKALSGKVLFLVFGAESLGWKGVRATGLLRDYRKMPLLFSAADLFVGTALEEAFGQTLCEAAACGLPSVAFNVGGVPEIARHNVNARLVDRLEAKGIIDEIMFFMDNKQRCEEFGRAGREIVEAEFTLQKQGERWMEYLKKIVSHGLTRTKADFL